MIKSITILLLLFSFKLFPQTTAPLLWTKSFGGSGEDFAQSILGTADGGCIVAGGTSSNNADVSGNHSFSFDFWIIKLNDQGEVQWKKCYGGSSADYAYSIKSTSDNAYIISGYTQSNNGDVSGWHNGKDFWIIKINSSGDLIWEKTFGGAYDEEAYDLQETPDGGIIVAGYTTSNDGDVSGNHGVEDFWVIKLNNLGNLVWQKTYGGSNSEVANGIVLADDGGYVVAGYTRSNDGDVTGLHSGYDYWVIKLSSNGLLEWQKALGGSSYDYAYDIEKTNDGGYILCGYTASNNGDVTNHIGSADYWVLKINSLGTILWQKCYGGSSGDLAMGIKKTIDGDYIINGYTYSTNYNLLGNPNINGTSSFWVIKINDSGVLQMKTVYGTQSGFYGLAIDQATDGNYIAAGYWNRGGIDEDYRVIKLGSSILDTSDLDEQHKIFLYPNPSNGFLHIECPSNIIHCNIYDVNGRKIQVNNIQNNTVDISQLQSGTYLILLEDENNNSTYKKFVKQ